ncbi:MAG: 4-amino-4-deoxy-L-arabinose transferase and related glycosyltransferases of PMT family [Oceanicaulis sp. HLUCCA04]|nr:MAG: 4-amino-4-deoxy-L-arabinose transferase and related glycosyltransferases of PMT family [Oceanicaulis sp. HLUCCA04]
MNHWLDTLQTQGARGGLNRYAYLLLVLIALAAMLPGFFSIPAMDRDESRYMQASRQMMESGDFIDIRFQDAARHKQPVGTYWAQVLTTAPFGGADAPVWAHRLPSLFGILAAIIMTGWLGSRLFSPGVGLAAGIILAVCLTLQVEARTAKTDALLLGFGMLAQISLAMLALKVTQKRPAFIGWPLALWAATAVCILIKGPIFTMVTGLTLAGFIALTRDFDLLRRIRPGLGLLVVIAIAAPWLVAVTIVTDGAFLAEAIGWSMLRKVSEAAENHTGPLGFHLMLSPVTLWPGAVLIALAVLAAWKNRSDGTILFLVSWIVPTWIVFELISTKLPHYVVPTFPAIALLMGLALKDVPGLLTGLKQRVFHWIVAGAAIVVSGVLIALPIAAHIEFNGEIGLDAWIAAIAGVVGLITVGVLAYAPSLRTLGVAGVGAIAVYGAMFGVVIPNIDAMWPSERVGRVVDQLEGCETLSITTLGYREPSNAFYLGTNTLLADNADAAADVLAGDPACGLAVVDGAEREGFDAALAARGISVRPLASVSGYNLVKGDRLQLTLLVTEGSQVQLP